MEQKEKLKTDYEKACNNYVAALFDMWNYEPNLDCFWIGDDVGGVYTMRDIYIDMGEIRYIVDNEIRMETVFDWQDYNVRCTNIGLDGMTLKAWCNNAPRYSEQTIKNLEAKTKKLNDMIDWAAQENAADPQEQILT